MSVELLKRMIAVPSFSREEGAVADLVEDYLRQQGCEPMRFGNNLLVIDPEFDSTRPTLLLNSHLDTVRPASAYTRDPFLPNLENGRLYGLGSNDAGGSVAALTETYLQMIGEARNVNLLLALTAEEEISGENGMRKLLPILRRMEVYPDMAIVGEPTQMHPAVAERGLMVIDAETHGVSGHAARNEGVNALYLAMDDISRLRDFHFDKESETLGPIKVTVTQIEAGRQHNVVPDLCRWVIDVRTTDIYSNEVTAELLQKAVSEATILTPRSTRIRASVIAADHPLVRNAVKLGRVPYVSPTTSDMALMWDFPTLKMGPGDSARSHTADEYIEIREIEEAVPIYCRMIRMI